MPIPGFTARHRYPEVLDLGGIPLVHFVPVKTLSILVQSSEVSFQVVIDSACCWNAYGLLLNSKGACTRRLSCVSAFKTREIPRIWNLPRFELGIDTREARVKTRIKTLCARSLRKSFGNITSCNTKMKGIIQTAIPPPKNSHLHIVSEVKDSSHTNP